MASRTLGRVAIAVHGGAWNIPSKLRSSSQHGAEAAVRAGHAVLTSGGSAVDAVEAAVRVLEDNVSFDAGTGSVLNADGDVEMDAIVMEGDALATGAVAGISSVANPVSVARAVMEQTAHCLLAGGGADAFARSLGILEVGRAELVTAHAVAEWEDFKLYESLGGKVGSVDALFNDAEAEADEGAEKAAPANSGHDTVGAVALDTSGALAAATSTGGITAKMVGRVGDSPLVGCGAYADSELGAVSTTGHGESILKVMLSRLVLERMERYCESPDHAAKAALVRMLARVGGKGGVIALSPSGEVGVSYNTPKMAAAWIGVDGVLGSHALCDRAN